VTARVAGVERTIATGDQLTIPAGVRHAFWNPGDEEAVLGWEVRPALRTEQMFEDLGAAVSTLRAAFVLPRYREEFRLSSALQRTLLDVLSRGRAPDRSRVLAIKTADCRGFCVYRGDRI
jgi:Cupin domain